jgi:hypothetical protein
VKAKTVPTAPLPSGFATRRTGRSHLVVAFPVFERYGDQIDEWLGAIDRSESERRTDGRIVKSMRRAVAKIERVSKSRRHTNLASFLRHAERDGARYLLMTALALMPAPPVPRSLRGGAVVIQLPVRVDVDAGASELTPDAVMGMVTG